MTGKSHKERIIWEIIYEMAGKPHTDHRGISHRKKYLNYNLETAGLPATSPEWVWTHAHGWKLMRPNDAQNTSEPSFPISLSAFAPCMDMASAFTRWNWSNVGNSWVSDMQKVCKMNCKNCVYLMRAPFCDFPDCSKISCQTCVWMGHVLCVFPDCCKNVFTDICVRMGHLCCQTALKLSAQTEWIKKCLLSDTVSH